MSEWTIFGERLKKQLEERGMTYRELAEKAGVSVTTICRFVNCETVPRATEVLKIANVLGVNCNYLLGVIDEPYRDCPYTPKQPAEPERLTDDDFETIRIHLNALKERLCNQRRWKEAEDYERLINRFISFASAQPEHLVKESGDLVKDLVNDCINRQDAIDALLTGKEFLMRALDDADVVGQEREKYSWGLGLIESYINDIEELTSAEPEIIKCKDCKWYGRKDTYKDGSSMIVCKKGRSADLEGFCHYAERRIDECTN